MDGHNWFFNQVIQRFIGDQSLSALRSVAHHFHDYLLDMITIMMSFHLPVLEFQNSQWGYRNRVGIGLSYRHARARIFKLLWSLRIDSKELIPPGCVAWRAGTTIPIPTRFLAPIDCLKIPAQATLATQSPYCSYTNFTFLSSVFVVVIVVVVLMLMF